MENLKSYLNGPVNLRLTTFSSVACYENYIRFKIFQTKSIHPKCDVSDYIDYQQ